MECPEDARAETLDELEQYIHRWDDAKGWGKRTVLQDRRRFIGIMVRWDGLDKPGIEFTMRAMCPGGDFVYPPPDG